PLRAQAGELELARLGLREVDRHREAAEPERDLHLRLPVLWILDLERLDAGHQLGHLLGVVQDLPDDLAAGPDRPLPVDLHAGATSTPARLAPGSRRSSKTRWGGLHESETIGAPAVFSASCRAAQIAWMAAPPPSPIPFVPSGVNGEGDSIDAVLSGG